MYGRKKNKLLNEWIKDKCVKSLQINCKDGSWYKGKTLNLNWLLLAESCLELSRETKEVGKRATKTTSCYHLFGL